MKYSPGNHVGFRLIALIALLMMTILLFIVIMPACRPAPSGNSKTAGEERRNKYISIHGANALYPMAQIWCDEYGLSHSDVRMTVFPASSAKGLADVRMDLCDIGMFSGKPGQAENEGLILIKVARDAVLPTINSNNPVREILTKTGANKEELRSAFSGGDISDWGQLAGSNTSGRINVFIRSDAGGATIIFADYLGINENELKGNGVYGDPGMTLAVRTDKFAIGYDNLRFIFDPISQKTFAGIMPLPVDFNGDGILNQQEKYYESLSELKQVILTSGEDFPLARDLYLVIKPGVRNPKVIEFLLWILEDGQTLVDQAGYMKIQDHELSQEIIKLKNLIINH